MKSKKCCIIKKNSSRSSNNSNNSNNSVKSNPSSNSNRKNKNKRKTKNFSRSRSKSKSKFKKVYKKVSKKRTFKIKSNIFTSKKLKTDSKQSHIIFPLEQFNDNLSQNSNFPEEIPVLHELYKNKSITDNFKDFPSYLEKLNNLSLFDKKEEVENNLETDKYSIEELLLMDQTNKKVHKKYIAIAIELLNSEKNLEKIEILKEKIKKSGIILDEDVYKQEIERIKILDNHQSFEYINYRKIFFETLKYILKDESNLIEAKNRLKIEKIYKFNQPAELGNNNYYFYKLCIELRNKMEEIFMRYNLYLEFIPYFLKFTEGKNFDNLTKNEKFLFNYQLEILLHKEYINNKDQLEKVMDFLNGEKFTENEIKEAIKSSKTHNNLNFSKIPAMNYELNYDKNSKKLNFLIKENRELFNKMYCFNKRYSYKIGHFNKKIIKIIEKKFDHNIESKLFENILPNEDYINELLIDIRPEFNRVIKNILSSKAAENFFNDYYKVQYNNLYYHLNREKVQEKILNKLSFAPIFNGKYNSITNPIDLSIIINSIPGIFDSENTSVFNRKILILGQYILFGIKEIMNHYCRHYYSYITGQIINIDNEECREIKTDEENNFYIEYEFVGITHKIALSISEALSFFYWKKYDSYPIIQKYSHFEINEEKMKIIIDSNKNIFNFIKIKDNDKDEGKITIKEYLELISNSLYSSKYDLPLRVSCPINYNEDYIIWY